MSFHFRVQDKRLGKGALIQIDEWCESKKIPIKEIKKWSLKYNFYLKKIGLLYYAYERDLDEAVQREIEGQEILIEKRRARAKQEAELRKKMRRSYFSQIEDELRKGSTFSEQRQSPDGE